jgi:hypothetical protein
MNSSLAPDKLNEPKAPETAAATPAVAPELAQPTSGAAVGKATKRKSRAPKREAPDEFAVLRLTLFSLFSIAVVVGLLFAWTGYSNRYAQVTEGWHIGQTKLVEVTVVREDKDRLACASDVMVEDIHCGWHLNGSRYDAHSQDDSHVLSPFNTVKNELFLGAGLWTSLKAAGIPIPAERFTAACNYKIQGVLKSVSLRWQPNASFDPVKQSVTVGSLSNCVIPK